MRIVSVILSVVCLLLLASVLICGLWIAHQSFGSPEQAAESRRFHMQLGIITSIASAALAIMVLAGKMET